MKDNKLSIISHSTEIENILKTGKVLKGTNFKLFYKNGSGRFAALASKKMFPTAVERNLIKRQIRNITKDLQVKNIDIVISAMQSWKSAKFELNKINLMKSYDLI